MPRMLVPTFYRVADRKVTEVKTAMLSEAFGGEELDYLKQVARRLKKMLPRQLDDVQKVALMDIISLYTFEFEDGFVINSISDPARTIGREKAAALVSCLGEPDDERGWQWWKMELASADKESSHYGSIHSKLLGDLVKYPHVRSVS